MALTLAPETETRLRTFAQGQDLDPEQLSDVLMLRALEEAEAELQDTLAGLDQSEADFAAGRWMTSEEQDRRMRAKFDAARVRLNGSQSIEQVAELAQA